MESIEEIAEKFPGGREDLSEGDIGLYITDVRGNEQNGIDNVEVVAVAFDDRSRGSYGTGVVELAIYGSDGELLNEVDSDSEQARGDTQANLSGGYDKVQIEGSEGRLPTPENGTYKLRWGNDVIAELTRDEIFQQVETPLIYAATSDVAFEAVKLLLEETTPQNEVESLKEEIGGLRAELDETQTEIEELGGRKPEDGGNTPTEGGRGILEWLKGRI